MAQSLRQIEIYPITVRELEVLRVRDITPGMRRVTLGGEALAAHTAENSMPVHAFRSDGFDDEFKLFFTHPSLDAPMRPEQSDGHVIWPRDERLIARTYTARRWDPDAGELDVDFVIHGHGIATTWARRVAVGTRIPIAGPKSSASHPVGADWTLVAGDETALPAIGRWLEEWPAGARGQVFVEIGEDAHRQDLSVPEGVELTWLSRHGAPPGTTTLLHDAITTTPWWPGTVFAWVSGEAQTLVPIRRWLKNDRQLPREQVEVTGYWRRQESAVLAEDPETPADPHGDGEAEALHALTGIVPGFAIRTAVTLGLPDLLAGVGTDIAGLAAATGADPSALLRLLRFLEALDVVAPAAGSAAGTAPWALTPRAQELTEEHVQEHLDLSGDTALREVAACLGMLGAVRPEPADPLAEQSRALLDRLGTDPRLVGTRIEEDEEFAGYYGATLAGMLPLTARSRVAILGVPGVELAEAVQRVEPRARLQVVADAPVLAGMRRLHPGATIDLTDPAGAVPADIVLLAGALSRRTADEARALLDSAAQLVDGPGTLLVFEEVLDPADLDEHDHETALIELATTGGGPRTDALWTELFAEAGHRALGSRNVGWGGKLYRLDPAGPG